ncbi:MAG: hypothetical protein R2864_02680 [Syntrophotaleaceae bacterium]
MILLMILGGTYLYFVIARHCINTVIIRTDKKWMVKSSIWFFILLPIWDVLLGFLIYFPLCWFWSGNQVYEKVDNVTGIYYQNTEVDYGITDYSRNYLSRRDIDFVEMYVAEIAPASIATQRGLHRFWINDEGKVEAKKISKLKSKIRLVQTSSKLWFLPITVYKTTLFSQEDLLSEYRSLEIRYLSLFYIPYFNWLHWFDQGLIEFRCFPEADIITAISKNSNL